MPRRRRFSMSWPKGTRTIPDTGPAPSVPMLARDDGGRQVPDKTSRGDASGEAARESDRRRARTKADVEALGLDPRIKILKQDANQLVVAAVKRMVEAHGISVETALLTLMAQTVSQIRARRGELYKYELMTNLKDTPLGKKVAARKKP